MEIVINTNAPLWTVTVGTTVYTIPPSFAALQAVIEAILIPGT